MMKNIELLSPAGSGQALAAAVQSGADAVYIGGSRFSARQGAHNFTEDEMRRWTDYCHIYDVKVYAAVNTLIKEKEVKDLAQYACILNDIGIDGVILQDMGAAEIFKQVTPGIALHASTQMTVTTLEGVRYLEKMGFSRVVLARELSREEIAYICKNAKAEIEIFVHGALCMCYSGQCLMSSIIGGRSGNRGCCAQPCRLSYELTDGKHTVRQGYLLSPKDIALIEEIQAIKDIGVTSLKIEGRLKRPEYVSTVTGIYRKYLDMPQKISKKDWKELNDAFNRGGFCKAYFNHEMGSKMMSFDNPGNQGDNTFTQEAKKKAAGNVWVRKIPVQLSASFHTGSPMTLTIKDFSGHQATVQSNKPVASAQNNPLDENRLKTCIEKLGDTPFAPEAISVVTDGKGFLRIADINALRREAVEKLIAQRIKRSPEESFILPDPVFARRKTKPLYISAEVQTKEQLLAAKENGIAWIYAPAELAKEFDGVIPMLCEVAEAKSAASGEAVGIMHFSQISEGKKMYGAGRLNIFNSYAARHFSKLETLTVSPELNLKEIAQLTAHTPQRLEVVAYGHLTLMIMKNCPVKASGKCQKHKNIYYLKDRKKQFFPLLCTQECKMKLLNTKPLYMADKINDIRQTKVDGIRLIFTIESRERCSAVIKEYKEAVQGMPVAAPPVNQFTRGHFYRGVL